MSDVKLQIYFGMVVNGNKDGLFLSPAVLLIVTTWERKLK